MTKSQKQLLDKLKKDLKHHDSDSGELERFVAAFNGSNLIIYSEGVKSVDKKVFNKPLRIKKKRLITVGPRGAVRSLLGRKLTSYVDVIRSGFQTERLAWKARRVDRRKTT